MEDLDPEEARAVIDPALELMINAVHRYDGYVVQSTGDGIFALFGAPVAHEDHPQRALYAALRIQEELQRYSAKVVADGGTPIQDRVGINSGEVVVRSIHTGAGLAWSTLRIGHMTNLAARMQTAAPVGSIAATGVDPVSWSVFGRKGKEERDAENTSSIPGRVSAADGRTGARGAVAEGVSA